MKNSVLKFRHEVIDPEPNGSHQDVCLIADINGNGRNDIVIGAFKGEDNLVWYESPTWKRHVISTASLEAGGDVMDITGNGRLDIVAGQLTGKELYWFENPEDPTQQWTRRIIDDTILDYHDQAFGDVNGDGKMELVALSKRDDLGVYYDIPDDPRVEPWPESCKHVIYEGLKLEGLAILDIDGDGINEVIAGTNIFKPNEKPQQPWKRLPIVEGWQATRAAVADLNGDGILDIVLCEAETHPARLAWFEGPDWKMHSLRDDIFHGHSLAIADFNGDGLPDIFVGEMGLGRNPDPRLIIYLNQGDGEFEEIIIQRGIPTHEAKVGDLTGDGRPDIVGKPFQPESHIDVWFNEI
ncbi:FG-GAP repeat domain-containing protein [Candidatus Poribacteria bacterium]